VPLRGACEVATPQEVVWQFCGTGHLSWASLKVSDDSIVHEWSCRELIQ